MGKYAFRLLSLLLATMPMAATAQTNVKDAFEAIIKNSKAQITETHTLEKDPVTNVKTGQSDVYRFILPADKANLVKKVLSAFDKDSHMAYSINRGNTVNTDNDITLAIGDATGSGVRVNEPQHEYMYALFLPSQSEDPEGKYRYAYGINWKEADGNITGKLIVTYATTLKYRQQAEKNRQLKYLSSFSNGILQQDWFDTLMSYFQSMSTANSQTRIALATKAYKVIRDTSKYPDVTATDKDSIREILEGMTADKEYSETILHRLLTQCLVTLK